MSTSKMVIGIMCFLMVFANFGSAKIAKSDVYVPEDLKLEGGLKTLRDQFYATQEMQEQIIIVKMITKTTDKKKFDVLIDILMFELRGADIYGQAFNTAPEARLIALRTAASTKNEKYAEAYASVLKFDEITDIRIVAAEAIGDISGSIAIDKMINLVRYDYNHQNFRENNQKMYNDDRVVEAIAKAMGKRGNPKFFPALLQIVTKRNHREETINAAWVAMELLKW